MFERRNVFICLMIIFASYFFISCQSPPCADNDGDGFFDGDTQAVECSNPALLDCDDSDPNTNPGATEICEDDKDNNCNGETDEGCDAARWDSATWDTSTWNP